MLAALFGQLEFLVGNATSSSQSRRRRMPRPRTFSARSTTSCPPRTFLRRVGARGRPRGLRGREQRRPDEVRGKRGLGVHQSVERSERESSRRASIGSSERASERENFWLALIVGRASERGLGVARIDWQTQQASEKRGAFSSTRWYVVAERFGQSSVVPRPSSARSKRDCIPKDIDASKAELRARAVLKEMTKRVLRRLSTSNSRKAEAGHVAQENIRQV